MWVLLASFAALSCLGASVQEGELAGGSKWAMPYAILDSGRPGPCVLITAGVHGNEPAGPRAAEQVRHWPIEKGRLLLVPRCNGPGLHAGSRYLPGVPGERRNLNRNFPVGGESGTRGEPAGAIWAFVEEARPEYVLDLHEGYGIRGAGSKSVGSSVIRYSHREAVKVQKLLLSAVNADVQEPGKRFVPLRGTVNGMLAAACAEQLGACAFICETTFANQNLSLRVRQHRLMVHALLSHLDMTSVDPNRMLPERNGKWRTRVAVYDGSGAGSPVPFEKLLAAEKDVTVCPVHPSDILDGALDQFDVVVFPGGSGSKQAAGLGREGRETVGRFVRKGGGFIGICAGAYLATSHYPWSLALMNSASLDTKHWRRGFGLVRLELTPPGGELFARPETEEVDINFRQGPILGPGKRPDLPGYEVLGWFRSGVGKNGADPRTMVDTPAIVRTLLDKGRVVLFSPHPEKTEGLENWVAAAVRWCADAPRE